MQLQTQLPALMILRSWAKQRLQDDNFKIKGIHHYQLRDCKMKNKRLFVLPVPFFLHQVAVGVSLSSVNSALHFTFQTFHVLLHLLPSKLSKQYIL